MSWHSSVRTKTNHHLSALRASAILSPGRILAGRFVIKAELGRGAAGQVFRAYDRATKTKVALKLVRAHVASRRSALDRLGREVQHAREVQHPNVCRVYELHEGD